MDTYKHLEGKICRTPWEPSGLVKVIEVEPGLHCGKQTAFIVFVGDHPKGYKDGDVGRYYVDELTPVSE